MKNFKTLDELDFVQVGKYYKWGNTFFRIDFKDEGGELYGVDFYSQEDFVTLSVGVPLCDPITEEDITEITEKEFYTALDLAREQFIKSFKAVRGGIL